MPLAAYLWHVILQPPSDQTRQASYSPGGIRLELLQKVINHWSQSVVVNISGDQWIFEHVKIPLARSDYTLMSGGKGQENETPVISFYVHQWDHSWAFALFSFSCCQAGLCTSSLLVKWQRCHTSQILCWPGSQGSVFCLPVWSPLPKVPPSSNNHVRATGLAQIFPQILKGKAAYNLHYCLSGARAGWFFFLPKFVLEDPLLTHSNLCHFVSIVWSSFLGGIGLIWTSN